MQIKLSAKLMDIVMPLSRKRRMTPALIIEEMVLHYENCSYEGKYNDKVKEK